MDLAKGLATRLIGKNVLYYKSMSSTMDKAKQQAQKGMLEGTVTIAEKQTSARGRLKRSWISPEGNLALSVVLYPKTELLPYLIMITSLAVIKAIKDTTGLKAGIKWPNDILINGRKVCGILIESGVNREKKRFAVIGIGLNVSLKSYDYPEIAEIATGLESELGNNVSRDELLKRLITELDELYLLLPNKEDIFRQWQNQMTILGEKVQIICGEEMIEGVAEDVSEDGSLKLRCENGKLKRVTVGDISLRKL
jgi:BirA family biotin operon repressor/biotin-[acetyl-CoA-carboxylase] ligase